MYIDNLVVWMEKKARRWTRCKGSVKSKIVRLSPTAADVKNDVMGGDYWRLSRQEMA